MWSKPCFRNIAVNIRVLLARGIEREEWGQERLDGDVDNPGKEDGSLMESFADREREERMSWHIIRKWEDHTGWFTGYQKLQGRSRYKLFLFLLLHWIILLIYLASASWPFSLICRVKLLHSMNRQLCKNTGHVKSLLYHAFNFTSRKMSPSVQFICSVFLLVWQQL